MKSIQVTVTFTPDDIRSICNNIQLGDDNLGAMLYSQLESDTELFREFVRQLKATPFREEIMDGSYDGCANGWMMDFALSD